MRFSIHNLQISLSSALISVVSYFFAAICFFGRIPSTALRIDSYFYLLFSFFGRSNFLGT
jgi:hypothetical protein